jgi:gamma-glutamyl phosphate reductase
VSEVGAAVTACGEAARAGAASLATAPAGMIDDALRGMAALLGQAMPEVLDANAADVAAGPAPAGRGEDRRHGRADRAAGRGAVPAR